MTCIKQSSYYAIDEQLRKFNGRYNKKVAMPKKPAKIGCNPQIIADGAFKIPIWYSITVKRRD